MEWLKEILKNAGIENVDEVEKNISKELPKYFKPANVFNETNEKLKTTQGELETLKATHEKIQAEYESYKKGSISQDDYEARKKEIEDNSKSEMEAVRKDSKIEIALINAGARNIKSVKANLDLEKVKLDGDKLLGFDEQLQELKKSDAYLFNGTVAVNKGADDGNGTHKKTTDDAGVSDEELDNMTDEEYYAHINKK